MFDLLQAALSNAVIVAVAAPVFWALARAVRQPAFTHALWVLLLVKLLTPPLMHIPLNLPQAPAPHVIQQMRSVAVESKSSASLSPKMFDLPNSPVDSNSTASWRANLLTIGECIWLGGSALCLGIAIVRIIRFRQVMRYAVPAAPLEQERIDALARRLKMKQAPALRFIPGRLCPMLWALGRPASVLMPEQLWETLEPGEREAILVHELAHWRRRDHWIRWVELLATSLFWWNPVCWWARRQLREAEEQCCDAWVLWATGDFRHYADALLKAVEFISVRSQAPAAAVPALASGMGQFGHLKRRIAMLKNGKNLRQLSWNGLLSSLMLGGALMPLSLTLAQEKPTTPPASNTPQRDFFFVETNNTPQAETTPAESAQDVEREIGVLTRKLAEDQVRLAALRAEAQKPHAFGVVPGAAPDANRGTAAPGERSRIVVELPPAGAAYAVSPGEQPLILVRAPFPQSPAEQAEQLNRIEMQLHDLLKQVDDLRGQQQQQSMNNVKQMILGCYNFAEQHQGNWPASLEEVGKASDPRLLTNPRNPGHMPGYVYMSPGRLALVKDPARRIVLYESFERWDGGICVGFADGHAEFVTDESQFRNELPN